MEPQLDSRNRRTLDRLLAHPTSGNLEWRQVRSLLDQLGAATEEHNGKLKVVLGGVEETLQQPHGKDVDVETIADLRRLLHRAKIA